MLHGTIEYCIYLLCNLPNNFSAMHGSVSIFNRPIKQQPWAPGCFSNDFQLEKIMASQPTPPPPLRPY